MMAARPKHTKRDANHAQMVKELRDLGFCVLDTADLGGMVLDLFVGGWRGPGPLHGEWQWLHVEVKPPGKRYNLTEGEREFFAKWGCLPAIVAEHTTDVIAWFTGSAEAVTEPLPVSP